MTEPISGIILAGGRSRRFGAPKVLVEWEGRPLIEHVVDSVRPAVSSILVMVKEPGPYRFLERDGVRVVRDLTAETHPLGGIFSGLSAMETGAAFVCGADMPTIRPELIGALAAARGAHDVAAPVWRGWIQPLCAVYSEACLGSIRRMIEAGRYRILDLFDRVETRRLDEEEVRAVDPRGESFVDLDTPDEYRRLVRRREERRIHAG
jgi:molybdopterin-guanine dinucleotide biosynthesis protein A